MKASAAESWPFDPVTFYDSRREREFYKYYEPLSTSRPHGQPPVLDISNPDSASNHQPRSSPDTTLTSFCQLGALRLKTRRCMLFFFDTEYAYVLAEATQTLSLQDDNDHDEDDALWLGTAVIPRGYSVCEHTVNIPAANRGTNQHEDSRGHVHIISNLTDDVRFCDRPFVLDGPKVRFYAGVPIITPTGASIGAYCALDDKPRDGLSEKEIAFMRQMSRNIIDHLETMRAKSVFGRGSRMLTSLDAFFKMAPQANQPTANRSPIRRQHRKKPAKVSRRVSLHSSGTDQDSKHQQSVAEPEQSTIISDTTQLSESSSVQAEQVPPSDVKDFALPSKTPASRSTSYTGQSGEGVITRNATDPDDDIDDRLEDSIEKTFQIAAELLQQASESDAVTFVDVQKRAKAGKVSRRRRRKSQHSSPSNLTTTDTDFTSTDGSIVTDSEDSVPRARQVKRYAILAQARSGQHPLNKSITSHYPSSIIRYMMKRYRRGHIWNFDSDGMASATESASDITETSSDVVDNASPDKRRSQEYKHSSRQHRVAKEMQMFQGLFPGVRAVSFVPLWDTRTEKIYAVALLTTYSPLRVLSNHGDLSFVRAFCDVVMASVGRLESASEEQAKTQFISSISHELRSPLHGILGGIDLLQGSERPDKMILSQIEKCSINLIDIIEHLLEYAKINNLSKQHTKLPGHVSSTHKTGSDGAMSDKGISLAELTEDVADAVFYSHSYAAEDQAHQQVEYIIDSSLEPSWRSNTSVGAWKRLCMNILNNALKHTTRGHIKLSLSLLKRSSDGDAALLTIADTGAGMSKEFLSNGLFQAFRQENSLTPGTGLGMSLVAKLVKSIGGAIEVRSEKHVGTTVKVIVPLHQASDVEQTTVNTPLEGIRVAVHVGNTLTADETERHARAMQIDAIKRHCAAHGMDVESTQPEVLFVFQTDLVILSAQERSELMKHSKALVVLCGSRAATCDAFLKELETPGVRLFCMTQPFGPIKILQTVRACLSQELATGAGAAPDTSGAITQTTAATISAELSTSRPRLTTQLRTLSQRLVNRTSEKTVTSADPVPGDDPPGQTPHAEEPLGCPTMIEVVLQDKMPLLLVDDNDINLRILQMYAKQNKHPYMTATDGKKAVDAYKTAFTKQDSEHRIYARVIFMDINMPVMTGFEATRLIRQFERSNDLPPAVIIALTGLGSREAQEQAVSSGVDIFLTKPVRSKELTMILQSISADTNTQAEC